MINLSNGMHYSLDKVGGKIWEMLESGRSLSDIAEDSIRFLGNRSIPTFNVW